MFRGAQEVLEYLFIYTSSYAKKDFCQLKIVRKLILMYISMIIYILC